MRRPSDGSPTHRIGVIPGVRRTPRCELTPIIAGLFVHPERARAGGLMDRGQSSAALLPSEAPAGDLVVAYEPVWAIGEVARPASIEHVELVHAAIRVSTAARGIDRVRNHPRGSVDSDSAPTLLAMSDVDGLFIGRAAALDSVHFAEIAHIAEGYATSE